MSSTNGRDRFLPIAPGKGTDYTGWQEPLSELVRRLRRATRGLRDRLEIPTTEMSIWPSAIGGEKVFEPQLDTTIVVNAPGASSPSDISVNPVVLSGRTTNISLVFPGPGVFVGRWLSVSLYMRLYSPRSGVNWFPMCSNTGAGRFQFGSTFETVPFTTRYSVFPTFPQTPPLDIIGGFRIRPPALNFFWNMQDPRSGRLYADRLVSHMMLLPQTWQYGSNINISGGGNGNALPDGDLFDLKAPWVFERDGQLTFQFRPITDFYQYISTVNGTTVGLPFDDREGGIRKQSVKVLVELHGYRFETMQDAMHAGALTPVWSDDENGAKIPDGAAKLARKKG